jgi:phospholipase C
VSADAWLQQTVPPLLDYLYRHDGLLLVTFDENGFSDTRDPGCCTGGPLGLPGVGGRIGLVALARRLEPGKVVHTSYDHMSLLRTLEDVFGISEHLNNAATATTMTDVVGS